MYKYNLDLPILILSKMLGLKNCYVAFVVLCGLNWVAKTIQRQLIGVPYGCFIMTGRVL